MSVSVLGNATLYLVARLVGTYPGGTVVTSAPDSGAPGLLAILGLSLVAPLTAAALFALLVRFAPRPGAVFLVVATAVYVAFLPGPPSLGAPLGVTLTLEAMHLVVAVPVVVGLLRTLASRTHVHAQTSAHRTDASPA
jgi:hypothetical protein